MAVGQICPCSSRRYEVHKAGTAFESIPTGCYRRCNMATKRYMRIRIHDVYGKAVAIPGSPITAEVIAACPPEYSKHISDAISAQYNNA